MGATRTIKLIGHRAINAVWRIGLATRFLFLTLVYSGSSFRRFHLIVKELFSTGVMSLIIIVVAGLFVGMVLGLQGYRDAEALWLRIRTGRDGGVGFGARAGAGGCRAAICQPRGLCDDRGDRADESH